MPTLRQLRSDGRKDLANLITKHGGSVKPSTKHGGYNRRLTSHEEPHTGCSPCALRGSHQFLVCGTVLHQARRLAQALGPMLLLARAPGA